MKRVIIFLILIFFLMGLTPVNSATKKYALIRLEDVSPWYALSPARLNVLYQIADFLYSKHVPFSVSLIPVYVNPKLHIYLSITNTKDPKIKEFNDAIKYMKSKGGTIGLHGYTHQNGNGITAFDFEFSRNPKSPIGSVSYMEQRVQDALKATKEIGISPEYWETPHYTASTLQYKYLEENFSILYEPGPYRKFVKEPYLVKSENPKIQWVVYIPTPLFLVQSPFDVKRLAIFARYPNPNILASFFFHPFREMGTHYLETIINAFQQNGFTFIIPLELRTILIKEKTIH